jgi:hypothetical protein
LTAWHTRVVVMTALSEREIQVYARRARDLGVDEFIAKPVTLAWLTDLLARLRPGEGRITCRRVPPLGKIRTAAGFFGVREDSSPLGSDRIRPRKATAPIAPPEQGRDASSRRAAPAARQQGASMSEACVGSGGPQATTDSIPGPRRRHRLPAPDKAGLRDMLRRLGLPEADAMTVDADAGVATWNVFQDGVLLREGDPVPPLYVVRSGMFKSTRVLEDSYEQVLSFALPGELLGSVALHGGRQPTTVTALQDSTVYALPWRGCRPCAPPVPRWMWPWSRRSAASWCAPPRPRR